MHSFFGSAVVQMSQTSTKKTHKNQDSIFYRMAAVLSRVIVVYYPRVPFLDSTLPYSSTRCSLRAARCGMCQPPLTVEMGIPESRPHRDLCRRTPGRIQGKSIDSADVQLPFACASSGVLSAESFEESPELGNLRRRSNSEWKKRRKSCSRSRRIQTMTFHVKSSRGSAMQPCLKLVH